MKILWVTNIILPYPSKYFNLPLVSLGGWLESSLSSFYCDTNYKIAVVSIYNGSTVKKCIDKNICYYLIPGKMNYKYQKKIEPYCKVILDEFKPDIIHLHGSEFPHSLAFIKQNSNAKIVLSIQGIVSIIGRDYLLGLKSIDIIKNITFRDIIRHDNLFQQRKKFLLRGASERLIINSIDAVIGRTFWDKSVVKSMNKNLLYFSNNETLRSEFYNHKWNINKIERHSIYVSQASYPLKGFHILLNALNIVKKSYPDVKVYIAGKNIIDRSNFKEYVKLSGYGKYIISLINKYDLKENVIFLGMLNEKQCLDRLIKSHISVVPSILENSSNSLCEAMIIGVPSVASYVGGTPSLINDRIDGLLYSCFNYEALAQKIIELFTSDELCNKISSNSIRIATKRHDKKTNFIELVNIYNTLYFGG